MNHLIRIIEDFLNEAVVFNPDDLIKRIQSTIELAHRGATNGERAAAKAAFERLIDRGRDEIIRMRQPGSGVTRAEIERFSRALQSLKLKPDAKPDATKTNPKFEVGQWVFADNTIGKITKRFRRAKLQPGQSEYCYDITDIEGNSLDKVDEPYVRAASEAAVKQASQKPKFKVGDYIFSSDDGQFGHIRKLNGFSEIGNGYSWWYEIEFDDGSYDTLMERHIRLMTSAEIAARQSQRQSDSSGMRIISFAHYHAERSDKVYGVVTFNGKIYTFWGGNNKSLAVKHYADREDADLQFHTKLLKGYVERKPSQFEPWLSQTLKQRLNSLG